jgi:nucleoside 2-deoxyribosyltransferase
MKVYLAGAIDGLSFEEANGWRERAKKEFRKHGVIVLNPLDGKVEAKRYNYSPNEIVLRDKLSIRQSDIVLAEITHKNLPYIGTAMEIEYCGSILKPVVVWSDWNRSPWILKNAVQVLPTLEECIEYIISYWGGIV